MKNPRVNTKISHRVLIIVPHLRGCGGIEEYYRVAQPLFTSPKKLFIRNTLARVIFFRLFIRYYSYIRAIYNYIGYNVVHINSTFSLNGLIRDSFYVLLARLYRSKVLIYFHGWDHELSSSLEKNGLFRWLFKIIYSSSCFYIVQAQKSYTFLARQNYKYISMDIPVYNSLQLKYISKKLSPTKAINIFFLSRLIRSKGLFTALEVFRELNRSYRHINLYIAGEGKDEKEANVYVKNHGMTNVFFHGFAIGEKKNHLFQKAHILFFPSSFIEGIPIVIMEAMWMGLCLVLHPIGGICDFFTDSMGPKIEKNNNLLFKQALEQLIQNPMKISAYGEFNHYYAKKHFNNVETIRRLEDIYCRMARG